MEAVSAACAMVWSIELDKGLRSKIPGRSVEAIMQIGSRLEQWNREPELTMAEFHFFDMVPGEDRLFANAILLRLADAFRLGDRQIKLSVVKVFLSVLRNGRKNNGRDCGRVLSKLCFQNHLELLRRVKSVFDTGDVESRALALILFGCWAEFGKNNAEIRYLILSSLVSSHALEVKASLFASGCFCELADDFAAVFLEMLVNILSSSETPLAIKLAGVRAFAKIGCSSSHASSAYKAGLKLLLDSSEEDFLVAMLISLSKIASKSMLVISEQVDLLFSFLAQERTFRLQATSLRCLHFILARGLCHFPGSTNSIDILFNMLYKSQIPPALHSGALQIMHKILLYNLPVIPSVDMLEFSKLLTFVENATQSLNLENRLRAIHVVVDISGKIMGGMKMAFDGVFSTLASRIISFVMDQIALLVKSLLDLQLLDSVERESQSLLGLLLLLVEEHPCLSGLVLERIFSFIEDLVNMHDGTIGTGQPELSGHEIVDSRGANSMSVTSGLLLHMARVVATCLENLDEAGAFNAQALSTVKLSVKHVHRSSLFNCYTHAFYSLLLHSRVTCSMSDGIGEGDNLGSNLSKSPHDYCIEYEILTLHCAKNMLLGKDNWSAYKVGKFAACQGAWFTASLIFEKLVTVVQSNSCSFWLKFLAQFALSERKIQLVLFPEQGSFILNWLENDRTFVGSLRDDLGERELGITWKINTPNFIENLVKACNFTHLSEETVGSSSTPGRLCFQRWFLAVRARVLGCVVDILKLIGTILFTKEDLSNDNEVEVIGIVKFPKPLQSVISFLYNLNQVSLRLRRLARELDLIVLSFIGMDSKSLKIISALALSCSLLAFSAGFAIFIPKLHAENSIICGLENSEDCLHAMLTQDLVQQLWHEEYEICTKLMSLLRVCGQIKSRFFPQYRNHMLTGYEARGIRTLCRCAITGFIDLQNEDIRAVDDETLCHVNNKSLQLLLDIVAKWMNMPFKTPSYFFRIRPCVSCELFALAKDNKSSDGISVLKGFHLSLNLCLKLENIPPDLPVRLTKLYCILYCRTSFQLPGQSGEDKGQMLLDFKESKVDDMVDLNEKLFQYVTGSGKNSCTTGMRDNAGVVEACVCFKPNERGQGFSACLLDVSTFPVGSYRVKWHGCCVDNEGSYWSLLPSNVGPVFTVQEASA